MSPGGFLFWSRKAVRLTLGDLRKAFGIGLAPNWEVAHREQETADLAEKAVLSGYREPRCPACGAPRGLCRGHDGPVGPTDQPTT